MNKYFKFFCTLLLFTVYVVPLTSLSAGEQDGTKIQRRIPYPPPTPPAPCPPMPPGVEMEQNCNTPTLEDLRKKYLETEGITNRGLNFYYYAGGFFSEHRFYDTDTVNQANYSFNTQTMFKKLGPPDYQKTLINNYETIEIYAYVFDYKSNKDYVMSVYTANGLVYRNGYSETALKIDDSWEKY